MDGLLVGMVTGIGVFLMYSAVVGMSSTPLRVPMWYQRWSDQVVRADIQGITVGRLIALSLALSLTVFILIYAWTHTLSISGIIALAVIPLLNASVASRARRRAKDMRVLWPEVVDSMVSGVRAGASLPDLFIDLSESAPAELRPFFVEFAREYRAVGRFDVALDYLKRRMADPVADRIVEALRLAREVGGADLSLILRDLAVLLREDARIRGELEARQSWTVNAARLGIAAPWLVLLMISGQAHASAAYSTPQGVAVLFLGGALTVVAYLIMQRVGRLSTEDRALR